MPVSWDIQTFDCVDSTQDTLKNLSDVSQGCVVSARRQKNGRGRHGRVWDGGIAENLSFSFALTPEGDARYVGLISLLCGVAVQRAAAEVLGPTLASSMGLMLKWPNDVLLDGRKLAGILIEREDEKLLVGIGVNICSAPEGLGVCLGAYVDVEAEGFRDKVLSHISALYALWQGGAYAEIVEAWKEAAHFRGTSLSVKIGERIERGKFKDLDEFGNLLLSQGTNQVKTITAGEVYIGI